MGGPTFSYWYGGFSESMCAQLESIVAAVSMSQRRLEAADRERKRRRQIFNAEFVVPVRHLPGRGYDQDYTALMGIHVERWREDYHPKFVRETFVKELGVVPLVELGGYCMGKQDCDWDALRLLATRIAKAFGGWIIQSKQDLSMPDLPYDTDIFDEGVREIVARSELMGMESRFWIIDARISPGWSVRK